MKADGIDIFEYVLSEKSVETNAPLELHIDEIATGAGMDVERFIGLAKWKKVSIAARWLVRRQLDMVVQDVMRVRAKAEK